MVTQALILSLFASVGYMAHAMESTGTSTSPHVITFFFKPDEQLALGNISQDDLLTFIDTPEKLHYTLLKQHRAASITSGIYVLYRGGITTSDFNGQITVPRLHEQDEIPLIITTRVSPVVTHGNTVDYFTLKDGYPARYYQYQRITDPDSGQLLWSVQEQALQTIRIPESALVILAPPDAITIPEQIYHAEPGPNLILPDIRIDGYIHTFAPALNVVPISRFFAQFHTWLARTDQTYARIIT